jgi:hypothetical protein
VEALLLESLNALVRRRKFIIVLTLLLGFIGGIRGVFWRQYQAQMVLLVTPLSVSGETTKVLPAVYPANVYSGLLMSPQVVATTLQRLIDQKHIEEEERPDLEDFMQYLRVRVETLDATTRPVTYSPLVRLETTQDTPELAEATVKIWSQVAMEFANEMLALSLEAASSTLETQTKDLQAQLDGVWKELSVEKSQYDIELMRLRAESLIKLLDVVRTEQFKVSRELLGFQENLASVRETLTGLQPYHVLARAPSEGAFFIGEVVTDEKRTLENLKDKVMVSQEINTVYWDTKAEEGKLLGLISANQAQQKELTTQVDSIVKEQRSLESAIGEHTIRQRDLETKETLAKVVYEDFEKTRAFNSATLAMIQGGEESNLKSVGLNQLMTDVYAIQSRTLLTGRRAALLGLMLGLLLSVAYVIVHDVGLPWARKSLANRPIAS